MKDLSNQLLLFIFSIFTNYNFKMNPKYIYILCALMLSMNILSQPDVKNHPIPEGTFIQDYLVANWSDEQWQDELNALKEVGMQYLVFGPALHTGKENQLRSLYPTSLSRR